jgi:hypothetical protein
MKIIVFLITSCTVIVSFSCTRASFNIDQNNIGSISIVIPDSANSISLFAASELKKHLDLIFKGDIAISGSSSAEKFRKHLYVGIKPAGYDRNLRPEESIYIVGKNSIFFFGDDAINIKYSDKNPGELKNKMLSEVLNLSYNRTGSLFAVYRFLEKELGVRWIKPGDQGLFYSGMQSVSIPQKEESWAPALIQRNIRTDLFSYREQLIYGQYAPAEFHPTEDEAIKKQADVLT